MINGKISFACRLLCITVYLPLGIVIIPVVLFAVLGSLSYSVNGCLSFAACYLEPLSDVFMATKTWKLLTLAWIVNLIGVCYMAYKNFKS